MKSLFAFALLSAAALAPIAASAQTGVAAAGSAVVVKEGKMLYAGNGNLLARVYRVTADGSPQLIIEGKLVTVPAATLTMVEDKVATTLSKREVIALR